MGVFMKTSLTDFYMDIRENKIKRKVIGDAMVIKRNGDKVKFDGEKIKNAVNRAVVEVYGKEWKDNPEYDNPYNYTDYIAESIKYDYDKSDEDWSVERIQDYVEKMLMSYDTDVAKAYILYRYRHQLSRQENLEEELQKIIDNDNTSSYAFENSNKNFDSVAIQRDYIAGIVSTKMALEHIFPKEVVQAHKEGYCYLHDLDYSYQHTLNNCGLINLEDMLNNGTVISGVKINKPKSLLTATTIATQIMMQVANSQYGGQTINLGHLAPFVRISYDKHYKKYLNYGLSNEQAKEFAKADTDKEIKDSIQCLNYQLSTLFSAGSGQAPFCSVFIYLNENPEYKDELIALTQELLRQRLQGMPNEDGVYITQAFPKILYCLDEDNYKPGTKYWYVTKQAVNCSVHRLVPDFISVKKSKELKDGCVVPSMGCRSFLSPWYDKDGNVKFWGRWNLGVCSLNPLLMAYDSHKDEELFFDILREKAELARKSLETRAKRLANTKSDVAPILWQHGVYARLRPGETLKEMVYNGYCSASLGFIGLAETVQYMKGVSIKTQEGENFATKIMSFLTNLCNKWKDETGIGFSLYATPSENYCGKACHAVKNKYKEEFEHDFGKTKDYLENSYHIPSCEEIDPFSKIIIEGRLQSHSLGGCLSYINCADITQNQSAIYKVIECIYNNCMYCEINVITSYCRTCGQQQTIHVHEDENGHTWWECENCGETDQNKMDVAARTCGYIGTNWWNSSKTQEIARRYYNLDNHKIE